MRFLSLFSGIGGAELGLLQVFPDAECMGFCEINKHCVSIYQARFPKHPLLGDGDIRHINFRPLRGKVDLVMAGFPCQDLSSINGQRQGLLDGKKSSLFFEALRCLDETQAPLFLFENVKSMPRTQQNIISSHLGVTPIMLDAAPMTCQTRKRLFWANFPIPHPPLSNKSFTSLLDRPSKVSPDLVRSERFVNYMYQPLAYSPTGRLIRRIDRYKIYSDTNEQYARCLPQDYNKTALVDRRFQPPLVRKFSVHECERLQGFPEDWTFVPDGHSRPPVPVGARYAALGNAINARVAEYIFLCLKYEIDT